MTELELDILYAINLIKNSNFKPIFAEKIYARVYQNTTENIKAYMPYLDASKNKALLPTASGDHILEAIVAGFDDITSFDINALAKYFVKMKLTAYTTLTKKEYIHFMYKDPLDKDYFDYFKRNLEEDVNLFWTELYNCCGKKNISKGLFAYVGIEKNEKHLNRVEFSKYSAENFTSSLDGNNYKLVQERLSKTKITYIDGDIQELAAKLDGQYDLINLTNIYEFVNRGIKEEELKMFSKTIRRLARHLNIDGKMLIAYLYKCHVEDFERYGKKSLDDNYIRFLMRLKDKNNMRALYDLIANKTNGKPIIDKLYALRNVRILKYLKDLDAETIELPKVGLGFMQGEKDMAIVYTKKR